MQLKQSERIMNFVNDNGGQVTNADAKTLGISSTVLGRMVQQQQLERLAPGVYIDPLEFGDDMAALQYRLSRGVYFKDTALFLYGLIDRTPSIYEMNFPNTYSYNQDLDAPLRIYRQKKELYEIGITEIQSPGGHMVKVYDVERTLCDILRTRDRSDAETIKQAMNNYVDRKGKNIRRLMRYAKLFKVEDEMRKYMEVLL